MASREKKISLSGKKSSSPAPLSPSKEINEEVTTSNTTTTTIIDTQNESESIASLSSETASTAASTSSSALTSNEETDAPKLTPIKNAKITRKIKRTMSKKMLNNQNTAFSPTSGKPRGRPKKIKPLDEANLSISSPTATTPSSTEKVRNIRVKNGVRKNLLKKIKQEDDGPPVLEPIFPVETKVEQKKIKKRVKKEIADDTQDVKKPRKKIKLDEDTETLEDVMNDLQSLIKTDDIQKEPETEDAILQPKKKVGRKSKIDPIQKRKLLKKETDDTIDNSKLIDGLDLNVNKVKKIAKRVRRHSIEKIPLEKNDNKVPNIFSNLPRSISPKGKRGRKPRQSIELLTRKKRSPYTTRSDSPARILRNGKHRKLKDMGLLEGVDIIRRRRRLCSDYSGSEISISKLSGYESDSSFSDLASIVGNTEANERESETKIEIKKEIDVCNTEQQDDNLPLKIKKSPSLETNTNGSLEDHFMDTNSNLCVESNVCTDNINSNCDSATICDDTANIYADDMKEDANQHADDTNLVEDVSETLTQETDAIVTADLLDDNSNPKIDKSDDVLSNTNVINPLYNPALYNDSKVPEKSIILDSMKHKFNETTNNDHIKEEDTIEDEQLDELSPLKLYSSSITEDEEERTSVNNLDVKSEENRDDIMDEVEEEEEEDNDEIEEHDTSSEHIEDKVGEEEIQKDEINEDEVINEELQEEQMKVDDEEVNDSVSLKTSEVFEQIEKPDVEIEKADSYKSDVSENLEETNELNDTENVQQEDLLVKEHILQALGLQSLKAAEEAKLKQKEKFFSKGDSYTGTLKTVIKLPKFEKKKGRSSVKMTLHKTKKSSMAGTSKEDDFRGEDDYKILKEVSSFPIYLIRFLFILFVFPNSYVK